MNAAELEQICTWYDTWGVHLLLYARSLLDEDLAQDVVQEVFIRLLAQRRPSRNVKAWLFRAVRNEAISQIRRRKRRREHQQRIATANRNWFETCPEDLIDAQTAQAALEKLDAGQREVVILRIWGQLTFKEIAEILERPLSSLHHSYQEALVALRKEMKLCQTRKI
ncbi:MAG: RNA polymerase sigma factor [Sedimentisphaerales bacterium]|nr:RNA polymerase sigma factor [Sedimentisphaerales bacterium]